MIPGGGVKCVWRETPPCSHIVPLAKGFQGLNGQSGAKGRRELSFGGKKDYDESQRVAKIFLSDYESPALTD